MQDANRWGQQVSLVFARSNEQQRRSLPRYPFLTREIVDRDRGGQVILTLGVVAKIMSNRKNTQLTALTDKQPVAPAELIIDVTSKQDGVQ